MYIDKRLKEYIIYAYENVQYYNQLFDNIGLNPYMLHNYDDIRKIPILDKLTIAEDPISFISSEYDINDLFKDTTSGSTGIPLTIYKSKQDRFLQGREIWKYRNRRFHVDINSKYCTWHIKGGNIYQTQNRLEFSCMMMDEKNLEQYAMELLKFEPDWLFGGGEVWKILAIYMRKAGIKAPASVKFIESTGEVLLDDTKRNLEEFFGCPVVNMYGCMECYPLAISCENNNMHWVENNTYAEVVDDEGNNLPNGKTGNIILTSFCNRAMPLIRYNLGDKGTIVSKECDCARKSFCIRLHSVRDNEYIKTKDGSMSSEVFHCMIERLNRGNEYKVLQYRVIQMDYHIFTVQIVLNDNSTDKQQLFKEQFAEEYKIYPNMKDMAMSIEFHDNIDLASKTGKYRYFLKKL